MTMHPSEGMNEHERTEALLSSFLIAVPKAFPDFTDVDREKFIEHDHINNPPADWRTTGQILPFYTEQGRSQADPKIELIFRPGGFAINYYNMPIPPEQQEIPSWISNQGGGFFAPGERPWKDNELPFALEKAQIHIRGFDPKDPTFRNELVEWSDVDNSFITIGDILTPKEQKQKQKKGSIVIARRKRSFFWNLVESQPEKARALAVERIKSNNTYITFGGVEQDSSFILQEIEEKSALGEETIQRELYKVDAYRELLLDKSLL